MCTSAILLLVAPKKDGTWYMYIDCRAINKITLKYHHPSQYLDNMIDELNGYFVFSNVDLRSGYHQILMQSGDKGKIVFKTKFGQYE